MYKQYHNIRPSPMNELLIANNTHHSYYTKHQDLYPNIGPKENVYRLFSIH